jgi:hypothetical protein
VVRPTLDKKQMLVYNAPHPNKAEDPMAKELGEHGYNKEEDYYYKKNKELIGKIRADWTQSAPRRRPNHDRMRRG